MSKSISGSATGFSSPPIAVVMPAAGSGRRFGQQTNKLFAVIAGQPLWVHSGRQLRDHKLVGRIVMPIAQADHDYFCVEHIDTITQLRIEIVDGGAERSDSVRIGLDALRDDPDVHWIAVHDAARPLVTADDLDSVFEIAMKTGAAFLAKPLTGTIRRDLGDTVQTLDRRGLYEALTPQVFQAGLLQRAYKLHNGRPATDDTELVQRIGQPVSLVPGSPDNLKITYPEDLDIAESILDRRSR